MQNIKRVILVGLSVAALAACSSTPDREVQSLAKEPTPTPHTSVVPEPEEKVMGFDVRQYSSPTLAMSAAVKAVEEQRVAADAAAWQMTDLCIGYITETYPLLTARAMYEDLTAKQYDDNKFIADTIRKIHVENAALMPEFVEHGGALATEQFQDDVATYSTELSNCLNYTASTGVLEVYLTAAQAELTQKNVSNIVWKNY